MLAPNPTDPSVTAPVLRATAGVSACLLAVFCIAASRAFLSAFFAAFFAAFEAPGGNTVLEITFDPALFKTKLAALLVMKPKKFKGSLTIAPATSATG